jgi:hypothetical protein
MHAALLSNERRLPSDLGRRLIPIARAIERYE